MDDEASSEPWNTAVVERRRAAASARPSTPPDPSRAPAAVMGHGPVVLKHTALAGELEPAAPPRCSGNVREPRPLRTGRGSWHRPG